MNGRRVDRITKNIFGKLFGDKKKKPSLNFSSQEIDLLSEEFKPDNSKALLVF